ncbi:DUF397 domain-containing protein [Streptomyces caeni]|uniref:DUF397 domain-containing protein n=1 Tax=Streptomyces caeni TaxID=2307231 RepID=A0ABW4IZC7_9ACTN
MDAVTEPTIPDGASLYGWRRSTYSGPEAGSCLEIIDGHARGVPVRDSKVPHGPALVFSAAGWASFVAAVKDGTR